MADTARGLHAEVERVTYPLFSLTCNLARLQLTQQLGNTARAKKASEGARGGARGRGGESACSAVCSVTLGAESPTFRALHSRPAIGCAGRRLRC